VDGTVSMVESDHRFECEKPAAAAVVSLPVVAWRAPIGEALFLPYPQATQTSAARGIRGKYPGLARRAA